MSAPETTVPKMGYAGAQRGGGKKDLVSAIRLHPRIESQLSQTENYCVGVISKVPIELDEVHIT